MGIKLGAVYDTGKKLSERDIIRHFVGDGSTPSRIVIPHMRLGTGYQNADGQRYIDLFIMELLPSQYFKRTAYEIKTSESDFYREMADPTKRRSAVRFANEFYFVAPVGIIKPKMLPPEAGLIEIYENQFSGVIHDRKVSAPWHDHEPNWNFLAAVIRGVVETKINPDSAPSRGGEEE